MRKNKNQKIANPVEYMKDIFRLRYEIANMLYKCGITLSATVNDGTENISTIGERIIPNGAICVQISRNFPSKIITPFGEIDIERLPFDTDYKKIIAFKELFAKTFQTEQLDNARLSLFDTYVGPWVTIRKLPWKQNRLPNYKFEKNIANLPNTEEKIKDLYNKANESFVADGTPEYCIEPNFEFLSSYLQK